MNNRNSLLALVCALVFVLASCLGPVGIEPGGKVHSERYETIDLQTRGMEYKVKTPAQWQIIMRLINIKSANALRAASSADTQTIPPVYTMVLGAGANITLPSSGAELNPPLTTGGVTLIVKGEDSANPSTLTLGGDGTLLNIGANRTLILENVIVQGKANNTGGPLINVQSGTVELRVGTVITGNTRTGGDGGGIYVKWGNLLVKEGAKVSGNRAKNGGGIYCHDGKVIIEGMVGGEGEGNISTSGDYCFGGGIYSYGGTLLVRPGAKILCNSTDHNGGGIYGRNASITIGAVADSDDASGKPGAEISKNFAGFGGGGIGIKQGTLVVKGDSIIGGPRGGNTATISGGGINCIDGTLYLRDNAVITRNGAGSYGGVRLARATMRMEDNSKVGGAPGEGNVASGSSGGGVDLWDGSTLSITGPTAEVSYNRPGGVSLTPGDGDTFTVGREKVFNNTGGFSSQPQIRTY
jgi:predicted outer membrane repeat protein